MTSNCEITISHIVHYISETYTMMPPNPTRSGPMEIFIGREEGRGLRNRRILKEQSSKTERKKAVCSFQFSIISIPFFCLAYRWDFVRLRERIFSWFSYTWKGRRDDDNGKVLWWCTDDREREKERRERKGELCYLSSNVNRLFISYFIDSNCIYSTEIDSNDSSPLNRVNPIVQWWILRTLLWSMLESLHACKNQIFFTILF